MVLGSVSAMREIDAKSAFSVPFQPSEEDGASEVIFPVKRQNGLMKSSLGLTFRAQKRHFDYTGAMKLKCTVTISESFSMSSEKIVAGIDSKNYQKGSCLSKKAVATKLRF